MSESMKADGTYQTPGGDAVTNIGWANATKVLVDRDEFERIVENSQRAEGRAWRACGVEELVVYLATIPRDHEDWPVAMEYARLVLPRWIVERIETQRWSGDYLRSALDSARRAHEHMIEIGWYKEHPDEMRDEKETDALGRFAADRVVKMEATVAALTAENERLTGLIRRAVDRYADHAVCKLSDGYGDPCTCGYEQWQIDAAAALPSSRETTDGQKAP